MPMTVVKLIPCKGENGAELKAIVPQKVTIKNKTAKKWLNSGIAITLGEAEELRHDVAAYSEFMLARK